MLANDIPSFVHVWQVNAAENARKSHEYRFKTNTKLVLDIVVIVLRGTGLNIKKKTSQAQQG